MTRGTLSKWYPAPAGRWGGRWGRVVLGAAVTALTLAMPRMSAVKPAAAFNAPKPPQRLCDPDGELNAEVSVTPPAGLSLVGLKLRLGYPPGVDLPGRSDEPSVKERVQIFPGGVFFSPNDDDGSLIVALVGTAALPKGPLMTIRFDRCKGAKAPGAREFTCSVEQGSDQGGALITKGIGCVLAPTSKKEKGR